MDEDSSATPVPAVEPGAPPAKWWTIQSPGTILVVLALINFLNYVDRMVLSPLVPFLKDPVEKGGLGLSSSQAGLLQTAFMVVHSLASIPLGIVADRYLRTRVIAIGVGLWSLATAAAGFARSFAQIFVMRAAVGIGEATYAPAASALISERFSRAARARALGVFQLGMVFGGAVGLIAGGVVAATWSWRAAFFVVGAPGLMLTALVLCIREPRRARGKAVRPATGPRPSGSAAFAVTTPEGMSAALWINVAGILITFFTGAIMFWAPQFILDARYGGDKAFLKIVSMQFGTIAVVAGIAGVMAGAFVADRLERRRPGAGRLITIAIGVFASAPCAVVGFLVHEPAILYVALGLGVFFNVWYVGPILAALHDVVPVHRRATATGIYLFLVHALGDAISPFLVGVMDDLTGSLRFGLVAAVGVLALGGGAVLLALPGSQRVAKLKHDAGQG